ncbi:MAG: hypothetical protein HY645_02265 [Acidobacteria bacterium]|nr:hypothetical protein [Acidobacteriota bacterium]
MKKLLLLIFPLLIVHGQFTSAEIASPRVIVDVPFSFMVGEKTLPSGEYSISRVMSLQPDSLVIRNEENFASAIFLSRPENGKVAEETLVVFNKYPNDRYFLSEILITGLTGSSKVMESELERELKTQELKKVSLNGRMRQAELDD